MKEIVSPLKLKDDVITRWNSTYFMFERPLKVREPLTATLGILNGPVECLTEIEWESLKNIAGVLKPFEQITTEMSAEKNVTLSKVIIIIRGLKSAIQKYNQATENQPAKLLIKHFNKEIETRFSGI